MSCRVNQPGDIQDEGVAEQGGNEPRICPRLAPEINWHKGGQNETE